MSHAPDNNQAILAVLSQLEIANQDLARRMDRMEQQSNTNSTPVPSPRPREMVPLHRHHQVGSFPPMLSRTADSLLSQGMGQTERDEYQHKRAKKTQGGLRVLHMTTLLTIKMPWRSAGMGFYPKWTE